MIKKYNIETTLLYKLGYRIRITTMSFVPITIQIGSRINLKLQQTDGKLSANGNHD